MFVNFVVSILTLISKQPVPSAPQLLTLNMIVVLVSLYFNLPKSQLNRFQLIQNSLAHAVVKDPKFSHATLPLTLYTA